MAARDEVLARIRSALGGSPADRAPPGDQVPRRYRSSAGLDTGALIGLLTERLRDYGTAVRRCPPSGVPAAVGEALAGRGARRVVVPAGFELPGLDAPGVTLLADGGLSPGALDAADGVITTAALAIAETGTILLHAGQIVGIVPEALDRLPPARPYTWISGPSATSDIELDRVQGVHGPRTLEVILIGP
jgi:L-lactate dehydrogenase complex protein LldG